jgi:uncharacterized membrane protein YhdT
MGYATWVVEPLSSSPEGTTMRLDSLIREIHRRSVWQVLGIYAVVAWIILQLAEILQGFIGLPAWFGPAAVVVVLLGFPVFLITTVTQGGWKKPDPHRSRFQDSADGGDESLSSWRPLQRRPFWDLLGAVFSWRNAFAGGFVMAALLGIATAGFSGLMSAGIGPLGSRAAQDSEAGAPGRSAGYSVRDSAGITIVQNTDPAWGEGEEWTLSSEPRLTIGQVDGPDEYTFYRANSAIRLEDGRILVTNAGSQELRYYDAEGRFLHQVGGDGEGPGELRSIGPVERFGPDSLALFDYRLLRYSVLSRDGAFGRVFQLKGEERRTPFPDGIFEDGSILASVSLRPGGRDTPPGLSREEMTFMRMSSEGTFQDSLTTLSGIELFRADTDDGVRSLSRPYGLHYQVVTHGNSWVYGGTDSHEYLEFGRDGTLLRIVRADIERRAVPREVVEDTERQYREMPNQRAAELWASIPWPERLPAYDQFRMALDGNLWVMDYSVLDEPTRFSVFDPSGRWLGRLDLPEGGQVTEIGADYLLGIWIDELEVQTIRMYALNKPGGG